MIRAASARRYAQAVYTIAQERQELERWQEDLQLMAEVFQEPTMAAFLRNARVPQAAKLRAVRETLLGVSPLALNLAQLLVARNRAAIIEGLIAEYERLINAHRGIDWAEVVTAFPLEADEAEELGEQLGRLVGKRLLLRSLVDSAILGGLVVRVGDRLFDGSTRTKLQALKRRLTDQRA